MTPDKAFIQLSDYIKFFLESITGMLAAESIFEAIQSGESKTKGNKKKQIFSRNKENDLILR